MTATAGTAVLVLEPAFGTSGSETCITTCADGSTDLLSVLYRERVPDRVERIERHSDLVDSAAIIAVGPSIEGDSPPEQYDGVRSLSDPADLTGMGMSITEWLGGLDDPGSAAVCVDSLSTMLQYTDRKRALKFLHAIAGQFRQTGGTLHCHLDPRAHEEQTVAQLRQVFDRQRRVEGSDGANAPSVLSDGGY